MGRLSSQSRFARQAVRAIRQSTSTVGACKPTIPPVHSPSALSFSCTETYLRYLTPSRTLSSSASDVSAPDGRKPGRAGLTQKPLGHLGGFSYPGPRKLADITKLPLLNAHNAQGVTEIWTEYHKQHASAIADTLSADEFGSMMQRSGRCPLFVIPIPREGGFFTLISQFQGRQCLVTYLEDYKRDPANAQPYVTLTLFDELLEKKGLGLLRAEFTNQLTRDEGIRYVLLLSIAQA